MFKDLKEAIVRYRLAIELAKTELLKSYTRTLLGPIWETISLGILMFLMAFIWSKLIKTEGNYVIYLVTGMIVFRYISQILNASTWMFIERADIVKCFNIPYSSYALAKVIYSVFIFFHHLPLIIIFSIFYDNNFLNKNLLYLIYSIPIILITSYSVSILVGMLTARFRDVMSLINTITSVMIFFTPILWSPDQLDSRTQLFVVDPNFFYHFIEIFRQPFLGNAPSTFSIYYTLIFAISIFLVASLMIRKFQYRLKYWV